MYFLIEQQTWSKEKYRDTRRKEVIKIGCSLNNKKAYAKKKPKKTSNLLTRASCSLNMEILNLFYPLLNFRVNFEGKTLKISF